MAQACCQAVLQSSTEQWGVQFAQGLTAGLCRCSYIYGDLLLIQVCSDPTPMHCSTGFGKRHSPLSSAALQNRLTAGLCHCNYIYGDLLFIMVGSDPTSMHCSTGKGKMQPPLSSAALPNRLSACFCHCNYIHADLLLMQVCSEPTPMYYSPDIGSLEEALKTASSREVADLKDKLQQVAWSLFASLPMGLTCTSPPCVPSQKPFIDTYIYIYIYIGVFPSQDQLDCVENPGHLCSWLAR